MRDQNSQLYQEIRQLWKYIDRRRRRQLGFLLLLMLVSSIVELLSISAIFSFLSILNNPNQVLIDVRWQSLFSYIRIGTVQQLVAAAALFFIFTIVFSSILRIQTLTVRVRLSADIGSDISSQVYQRALCQPYLSHVKCNSSDLMQTVIDDTNRLNANIMRPLLALFTDSFLAFVIVVGIFAVDAHVATATAFILGIAYIVIYRSRQKLLRSNSKIVTQANEQKIKAVQEGLGGIRDVLIANTQDYFQKLYEDAERPYKQAQATNNLLTQTPSYIIEAIVLSSVALLALFLSQSGDFTQVVPILGSLALGAKRLLTPLQSVFGSLATVQGARSSLSRILLALQRPIDLSKTTSAPVSPIYLNQELTFEDVWFRYDNDAPWVLKGLDLSIAANTTVGFVGSTGSGKSTTADLILGLLHPQKGIIQIDGQPLTKDNVRAWQQGIAHVPQSIFLKDASIAENIAFAIPQEKIDFKQVIRAAKLAQIDEFIQSLPAGYDTYTGERGVRLSGGQRQRIGIARALYRQAQVIVFDEATSALDNATEKEVMAAIDQLTHKFTIIMIAHRLSTLEKCDKIFELHQGKVVAEGKYKQLSLTSKSFRKIASLESGDSK